MKRDIHKLADWLVQVCQEGVAIERKIIEWKKQERQLLHDKQPKAR